jgi:predicted amidophosphoribosyltransferase
MASDQVTQSASEESGAARSDVWCGECRTGEYEFDLARSYGVYAGALRSAILQLKFHRRERLGRKLGKALARAWIEIENKIEPRERKPPLLVPVPLHPSRERERGFNQAELLAQGLARALNRGRRGGASEASGSVWGRRVRVEASSVRRARPTLPQAGLSLSGRQENVRGVFEVRRPERLRDRVVVLVDDVMTTGWTASACAGAIKRAGARQVVVLTMARATPQFPDRRAVSVP